ncbi:MAG TPA: hypothetical protein DD733_08350, partial [Clostridiales bacterium]|nr:hypothetical protein [Clostridiales bacterium]
DNRQSGQSTQIEKEQNSQNQYNQPYNTAPQYNQQPPFMYSWDAGQQAPIKKKKGLKIFAATVSVCLIFTLVLIAWSIGMGYVSDPFSNNSSNVESNISDTENSDVSIPQTIVANSNDLPAVSDLTELYDKIDDSCVTVETDIALGSGFVVTADGYVITNHHVIENAKRIKVIFYDDTEYNATLVGSDKTSDIAVLDLEGEFVPIDIGNSDNILVGEKVIAIGTPYSKDLAGTMTEGIISGIARDIKVTNDTGTVVKTMTLIQTDTSINPGNSGGPLVNMNGSVIGINTLKLMDEYEGLGFAIPINSAIKIANALIAGVNPENDFVSASPKLNITVMTVSDAITEGLIDVEYDLPDGAFVTDVARKSAIYMAGLEQYDIITEFNGVTVTSKEELIDELGKYKAGDSVTIKVFRLNLKGDNGEYLDFSFNLDPAG